MKSADLIIGGKNHPMKLVGGYWGAWTGPITGATSFKITEENGYTATCTKVCGFLATFEMSKHFRIVLLPQP